MTVSQINGVAVRGLLSVVPSCVIDNLAVEPGVSAMRTRLVRNVGIRYLRRCQPDQTFCDISEQAARVVLKGLGWDTIDVLIVVTQSPDYLVPGNAVQLQHRLGLPRALIAFDINLGCSGFPIGLFTAASMLKNGGLQRALVLVGDQAKSYCKEDEGREILFSDAASVVALEVADDATSMFFKGYTDGAGFKAIHIPHAGRRNPLQEDSMLAQVCEDGVVRKSVDLWLDGPAILSFSTREVPLAIRQLLAATEIAESSIDRFFLHQANHMINETIRKKLGIDPIRMPTTLYEFGNTSSASIPLTMTVDSAARLRSGHLRSLLCGFGVGLSWGSMILDTHCIFAPDLIEV